MLRWLKACSCFCGVDPPVGATHSYGHTLRSLQLMLARVPRECRVVALDVQLEGICQTVPLKEVARRRRVPIVLVLGGLLRKKRVVGSFGSQESDAFVACFNRNGASHLGFGFEKKLSPKADLVFILGCEPKEERHVLLLEGHVRVEE